MDFELPGEDHPKRRTVRAWFEANLRPSGRDLAEAGYVVPLRPKPWRLAADPELQIIIDEEMKRAGVSPPRNPAAINHCAQSLLTHGCGCRKSYPDGQPPSSQLSF
jgi:3-oxochol-4-en-24-oyl-CoA dehydrogenase